MAVTINKEYISIFSTAEQDWLESLGTLEDIQDFKVENEILPDGHEEVDGKKWKKWKLGNHRTITIGHTDKVHKQRFVHKNDTWALA